MNIHDMTWRAYAAIANVVKIVPLWRLKIGDRELGDWLDHWLRRRIPLHSEELALTLKSGATLWLPPGYQNSAVYRGGIHEPATTGVFNRVLRPGDTVVDAGAHLGYFTVLSSELVRPHGRVYSFEPDPVHFEYLKKNTEVNRSDDVVLVSSALGLSEGSGVLFSEEKSSGSSLYRQRSRHQTRVSVDVTCLDTFFGGLGWPTVDLVKMDLEGGERAALAGMRELVHRNASMKLIVEFDSKVMRLIGANPLQLISAVTALGFVHFNLLLDNRINPLPTDPESLFNLISTNRQPQKFNLLCET